MAEYMIVNEAIKENKFMVFSKTYCGQSGLVRKILKGCNIRYGFLELDLTENGNLIHFVLKRKTQQTTLPYIFIEGKYIGGWKDLLDLKKSGELAKIVNRKKPYDIEDIIRSYRALEYMKYDYL